MPELTVPGAILHYETFGTKDPLLVLISDANGRGSVFHPCAQYLASHFKVVCWDRRGYSQSFLTGQQDFENRLQTDADDARRIITRLSQDGTAIVFGTSSGAIVAFQLLASHPECVLKLIAHEPPAFSVLPEELRQQACGLMNHVYNTYRAHGPDVAMEFFASALPGEGPDASTMRHCMDIKRGDEIRANCLFWFEFELRQYTSASIDIRGLLTAGDRLVLVAGEDSGDGPGVEPIKVIAGQVGKEVFRTPGGHLSFMTVPELFSRRILDLIGT